MRDLRIVLFCVPLLWLLSACAGRAASGSGSRCELTSSDSVYLATGPVYRDCAVNKRAHLLNRDQMKIDYRPSIPPRAGERCLYANLEFVVDTAGKPEIGTARVVHATEPMLGAAVLQSLPQWRYAPAQKDGSTVRQIVRDRYTLAVAVTVAVVRGPVTVVPVQGTSRMPPQSPRSPSC